MKTQSEYRLVATKTNALGKTVFKYTINEVGFDNNMPVWVAQERSLHKSFEQLALPSDQVAFVADIFETKLRDMEVDVLSLRLALHKPVVYNDNGNLSFQVPSNEPPKVAQEPFHPFAGRA